MNEVEYQTRMGLKGIVNSFLGNRKDPNWRDLGMLEKLRKQYKRLMYAKGDYLSEIFERVSYECG